MKILRKTPNGTTTKIAADDKELRKMVVRLLWFLVVVLPIVVAIAQ